MPDVRDIVDGWQIQSRADGGYGVYDDHGLMAGPFGRRDEAIAAALRLPKLYPVSVGSAPEQKARR